MSYIRTSRGMGACPANADCSSPVGLLVNADPPMFPPSAGAGLPVGVSIAGSCDPATGMSSGNQTGYYLLAGPNGSQCLTDAQISAMYPTGDLVVAMAPGTTPVLTATPAPCTTSQCLADAASLNAATGGAAPAAPPVAAPSFLGSIMTWIEANPLLAVGLGVGAFLLAKEL